MIATPGLFRSKLTRDMTLAELHLSLVISLVMWVAGLVATGLMLLAGDDRVERQPVAVAFALCILGIFIAGAARIADLNYLWRWYGVVYLILTGLSFPALALGIYGAHDPFPEAAAFFLQTSVFCWFSLRRGLAAGTTLLVCLTSLIVLLAADGLTGTSLVRWLCVALPVLSISTLLGPQPAIAAQASRAAEAAQAELADVNAGLELRVAEQVAEIERGKALRRFLSPEVADVVLADDALLRPHRREVAVFFCDLRGFTAFTSRAEPEDVVRIVSEYYEAVGDVLRRHGAPIGGYAGDGIMAYVGDPLPTPEPAAIALRMAAEVRTRVGFSLHNGGPVATISEWASASQWGTQRSESWEPRIDATTSPLGRWLTSPPGCAERPATTRSWWTSAPRPVRDSPCGTGPR